MLPRAVCRPAEVSDPESTFVRELAGSGAHLRAANDGRFSCLEAHWSVQGHAPSGSAARLFCRAVSCGSPPSGQERRWSGEKNGTYRREPVVRWMMTKSLDESLRCTAITFNILMNEHVCSKGDMTKLN